MSIHWFGSASRDDCYQFGSLAVVAPLLEQMNMAAIIDRNLPADPQAEFTCGPLLTLLLAARLAQPVALVNAADWAQRSGAALLWDIPPEKLNDDRFGRALDNFYYQRHPILASIALEAAHTFEVPLDRLHYDPTHIVFHGDYATSRPRADPALDLLRPADDEPPAHITFGYGDHNTKLVHAGVCAAVDDYLGAVPLFGHVLDGNHNGHTAIAEQLELFREHLPPAAALAHLRPWHLLRRTPGALHATGLYGRVFRALERLPRLVRGPRTRTAPATSRLPIPGTATPSHLCVHAAARTLRTGGTSPSTGRSGQQHAHPVASELCLKYGRCQGGGIDPGQGHRQNHGGPGALGPFGAEGADLANGADYQLIRLGCVRRVQVGPIGEGDRLALKKTNLSQNSSLLMGRPRLRFTPQYVNEGRRGCAVGGRRYVHRSRCLPGD
jgi:hypothetical protein